MGNASSKPLRTLPKTVNAQAKALNHKPLNNNAPLSARGQPPQRQPDQENAAPRLEDEQKNSNAMRMHNSIRVEEIPLKLDQSHPALRTLRNRSQMESMLKNNQVLGTSVHPTTFVAIVDDLEHYSLEEIQKRYQLKDEFIALLKGVNLHVAHERIEKKSDVKQKKKEDEDFELDRMNGLARGKEGKHHLEGTLEELMGR